jgi:hypothetical protein
MDWTALNNRVGHYFERLQSRNRKRLTKMLPYLAQLALLGTLLLGLYQVLRLEPSRKRLHRAS